MKATEFGKTFNTTLQNVDEKYKWVNDMIKARQDLVLMYMKILNVSLSRSSNQNDVCYPSYEDVTSFCNHLIDYISHGHFDLYPKIIELIENASGRSLSIANRTMPKIEATTEYLMRFTDKLYINIQGDLVTSIKLVDTKQKPKRYNDNTLKS